MALYKIHTMVVEAIDVRCKSKSSLMTIIKSTILECSLCNK